MNTSSSSRLVDENSDTTAPSGPAWNQCNVSGRDRELLPRTQDDLLIRDVEVDEAGATAERLLFSGRAVERRMAVLRAGLVGEEDELLRAVAVGVHVDEQLQADLPEPGEAEVRDLDRRALGLRDREPGRLQLLGRICLRLAELQLGDHVSGARSLPRSLQRCA